MSVSNGFAKTSKRNEIQIQHTGHTHHSFNHHVHHQQLVLSHIATMQQIQTDMIDMTR